MSRQKLILQPQEIQDILDKKRRGGVRNKINRAVFCLATCCGLRPVEIPALTMSSFDFEDAKPFIQIRGEKGHTACHGGHYNARKVPLFWNLSTYENLLEYYNLRLEQGADLDSPFLFNPINNFGNTMGPIGKDGAKTRWRTYVKDALGEERSRSLAVDSGLYTFAAISLWLGRSIPEVAEAVGVAEHSKLLTYQDAVQCDDPPDWCRADRKPPVPKPRDVCFDDALVSSYSVFAESFRIDGTGMQ